MIRAPTAGHPDLRHDQRLAEAGVEPLGDIAHQLHVLALVFADRYLVGSVAEHVGGLEHRIEEQPAGDQVALGPRLLLELGHPVELTERRDAREQPAQLGVLLHVALSEEDAALGVEPGGEQDRRRVVHGLAERLGLVGDGDRVKVDDAVDRLAAVLPGDVLGDRADVVAEVLTARRLDAGEDPHGLGSVAGRGGALPGGAGAGGRCVSPGEGAGARAPHEVSLLPAWEQRAAPDRRSWDGRFVAGGVGAAPSSRGNGGGLHDPDSGPRAMARWSAACLGANTPRL